MPARTDHAPVVAGVDRRPHDEAVLAAALQEAACHGTALCVVHVVDVGTALPTPARDAHDARRLRVERRDRRTVLHAELRERLATMRRDRPGVPAVDVRVEHGDPATVLLAAAGSCRMIVLGVRSAPAVRAPFLLGRVSQDVAVHAPCPVLLVPVPS